eukprot:TRINITY_DN1508_c0_g1_i1.p1 TRINITY_DN1508_c0_g1~~TRINITY_DN1508_c0_g1_i1.p1  ORF type:complete len:495 (+),score=70.92 TRINITY_DN1508_c0_g1_i1:70-1485(+)
MDWLNCVSFSSDASLIVSGSWDFNIKIWNLSNCQDILTLNGHLSAISRCMFTADEEKLISSSYDGTLKIWDAKKGVEVVGLAGHSQRVNDFTFLQDTKVVCSVSDDATIRLWDVLAGSVITNLEGHSGSISSCSFSPNQEQPKIISTSEDCTVKTWDPSKAEKISGHLDTITALDMRGKYVVSASRDCSLCLWQVIQETVHPDKDSPKDEESFVRTNLKKAGVFLGHTRPVNDCCFDQKGRVVLSCGDDGRLVLRDLSGKGLFDVTAHDSIVSACAISKDATQLLSGSWDHTIKLWDAQREIVKFECDGFSDWVTTTSFSPDGQKILGGSYDKTVRLWDQRSQGSIAVLETNSWVQSCSWQNDSLILSAEYDGNVRIWDSRTLSCIQVLKAHEKRVNDAIFASDGLKEVISVSEDSTLRCFSLSGADLCQESSKFFLRGLGTALCCSPFNEPSRNMVAADSLGNLYLLNIF